MAEEDEEEPSFGKGCRKGGARHFSKPFVDNGLVYSVFVDNKDLLQDLKNYECTSKNNSPDAKGLVKTLPLWKGLLRLESSGEIHSQPLRTALIKLLSEYPEMNRSAQSGQVWAKPSTGEDYNNPLPCSKDWKGCRKGWPVCMCSQADKAAI